jgi:hypothetical protein
MAIVFYKDVAPTALAGRQTESRAELFSDHSYFAY